MDTAGYFTKKKHAKKYPKNCTYAICVLCESKLLAFKSALKAIDCGTEHLGKQTGLSPIYELRYERCIVQLNTRLADLSWHTLLGSTKSRRS